MDKWITNVDNSLFKYDVVGSKGKEVIPECFGMGWGKLWYRCPECGLYITDLKHRECSTCGVNISPNIMLATNSHVATTYESGDTQTRKRIVAFINEHNRRYTGNGYYNMAEYTADEVAKFMEEVVNECR